LYYHLVYLPFLLSVGQHCFPFLVVLWYPAKMD
jgi:hypothetical protein